MIRFALVLALLAGPVFAQDEDPYAWLEDISGDKALEFVEAQNAATRARFQSLPAYRPLFERLRAVYDSKDRIPEVVVRNGWAYNFWRDAAHPRGVFRRTRVAEYGKPAPKWETLLDLDALAEAEKENWVWGSHNCLEPAYRRCLIALSRGGTDAEVTREFDVESRRFVSDGFVVPESKGGVAWRDADAVYVFSDFGAGSMTTSGYPRVVKEWKRGTPLAAAKAVFEGAADDVSVSAMVSEEEGYRREWVHRAITFYTGEWRLRRGDAWIRLDVPADAELSTFRDQLLIALRSDWTIGERRWPQGSLLAVDLEPFLRGDRVFTPLYEPGPRKSIGSRAATRRWLLIEELDNVQPRLFAWQRVAGRWVRKTLPLPGRGRIDVREFDPWTSDAYWLTVADPVTPTTLFLADAQGRRAPRKVKSLPAFFDAAGVTVTQHEAVSRDGTRVPYVQVSPKGYVANGKQRTLLYGYGGFENAELPAGYSATFGLGWVEGGGVLVRAGIRGGGEFGPAWHQAAVKANRQRSFDDFIAIAEDLVRRGVTAPPRLGILGGSNGGLLVGAVMTQRPELFGAVVCQVPLLDMRRYHKLLAGASWMGEYGNPDQPEDWAYLSRYSPYHNLRSGVKYPPVLFATSTRDDRVHPGHARKMFARMKDMGQPAWYFENTEGGHAGAANNDQLAALAALGFVFLQEALK